MAAPSETWIVLMGKTGNGKSSTGNSILGRSAFKTGFSAKAVTSTCQLESGAIGPAGRIVRVIDTPGFFGGSDPQERLRDEVAKCLELAEDGVHAIVLVLSVRNRFTKEEMAVVEGLKHLFGEKVMEYMIVLFTGGNALEEDGRTLAGHTSGATGPLKALLSACGGRKVLFDNKTGDKEKQVAALLQAVDAMVGRNGGRPYTNELFEMAKALALRASIAEAPNPSDVHTMTEKRLQLEKERKLERYVAGLEVQLKDVRRKVEVLEASGSHAQHQRADQQELNGRKNLLGKGIDLGISVAMVAGGCAIL